MARAFEMLLEPLKNRLAFRWSTLDRNELESWALDTLIAYLETPTRYDPKQSALLTYLVMDADGDMKNAYSSARAKRERLLEDVEDDASRRNETTDDETFDSDDRAVYARLRAALFAAVPSKTELDVVMDECSVVTTWSPSIARPCLSGR